MITRIYMLLTVFLIGSNTHTAADVIQCNFTDNVVNDVTYGNIYNYKCSVIGIISNGNSNQIEFSGTHVAGKSDNDVKAVHYDYKMGEINLSKFDATFCRKFKNLEYLVLVKIKIQVVEENSLRFCENLKFVEMDQNGIDNFPENFLPVKSQLKDLRLTDNKLTTLPENFFANQEMLERFNMFLNDVNFLPANIFKSLRNVRVLNFKSNSLPSLSPSWFENLHNLQGLYLYGNYVTELQKHVFKNLKNLMTIDLFRNDIATLDPECFVGLTNLKSLRLRGNQISELPKNVFAPLTNLEDLDLRENQIKIIHADSFGYHSKFMSVKLWKNKIESIDEKFIDNVPIGSIDMSENVCSKENLTTSNKYEIKAKLQVCFRNYQPREPTTIPITSAQPRIPLVPTLKPVGTVQIGSTGCGKPQNGIQNIFGGNKIKHGDFPWHAALLNPDGSYFCGGTLVSGKRVVTAAHCILQKREFEAKLARNIKVLLGAHNLTDTFEFGRRLSAVKTINIHNNWHPHLLSFDADIAVLELVKEIQFDEYIQPICLIQPGSQAASIWEGTAVGFGRSEFGWKEEIARTIQIPIYDLNKCLQNDNILSLLGARTICGGGDGINVCAGDSGSGVVVFYESSYYLRGIVSSSAFRSPTACNVQDYAVFTDAAQFYDFISQS